MVNVSKISKMADSLTFKHIQNPNTLSTENVYLTTTLN